MNEEKKILFLHGFFASGQCVPALALREALQGKAKVLSPDLPLCPSEVLLLVRDICKHENPNVVVGNSCGSFYAQWVAPEFGIPTLLGNPHFQMTDFLKQRLGEHQYKSPRQNGCQKFVIDENLINEFATLEPIQFEHCTEESRDRVWGLFGEKDTLAHFEPLFLQYYTHSYHFPGGHTPTAEEVRQWYVPLIEKLINENV
ncbi:MAG: hypothetical protein K6C10_11915 [Prevotella sp.]|nr:hypothetical protein [Prevotella sp.]